MNNLYATLMVVALTATAAFGQTGSSGTPSQRSDRRADTHTGQSFVPPAAPQPIPLPPYGDTLEYRGHDSLVPPAYPDIVLRGHWQYVEGLGWVFVPRRTPPHQFYPPRPNEFKPRPDDRNHRDEFRQRILKELEELRKELDRLKERNQQLERHLRAPNGFPPRDFPRNRPGDPVPPMPPARD